MCDREGGGRENAMYNSRTFPQRLQDPKKGTTNAEIYKLFEQVKINIPLLDAIKQIFAYAKFLKDLCIFKCTMQV